MIILDPAAWDGCWLTPRSFHTTHRHGGDVHVLAVGITLRWATGYERIPSLLTFEQHVIP